MVAVQRSAVAAPDTASIRCGAYFDDSARRAIIKAVAAESRTLTQCTGLELSVILSALDTMLAQSVANAEGKRPAFTNGVLIAALPRERLTATDVALAAIQFYYAATQCSLARAYRGSVRPSLSWYGDQLHFNCHVQASAREAWFEGSGIIFPGQMARVGRDVTERFDAVRDQMSKGATLPAIAFSARAR